MIPTLARDAYVIAPDLPGFGESEPLEAPSFDAFTDAIHELLEHLAVGHRYLYVHDFGAPVALSIAMREPERVLGLIVQNANAHSSGWGPGWAATRAFWSEPDAQNTAEATAHLTLEGTRQQHVAGVPDDVAARLASEAWEEDWRVMCLPGRMRTQRALITDYGRYAERFDAIADYFRERQPAAVMVWGRHDAFFDIAETLSWLEALPRMEAHLLLETHATEAASLIAGFLRTRRHP